MGMNRENQQKLKAYLDAIESDGEIASFVARRIRIEGTFRSRDRNAQVWAVNFALLTGLTQLVLLLRQVPYRLIFNYFMTLRPDLIRNMRASVPAIAACLLIFILGGALFWNAKKSGGKSL